VNGNAIIRNQSYYIIAHASKFVRPGSRRIYTTDIPGLANVAFLTPDGKKVLVVINTSKQLQQFNFKFNGTIAATSLNGGAVATYVW
jgi:glucosylceramidase